MTEHREPYVVTPRAAAAQYRGCQQALSWALRELTEARAEVEALKAKIESQQQELEDWQSVFGHLSYCPDEAGNMINQRMSDLEERVRDERERCAYIAAGFGGTGCGATIAAAIRTREAE